MRYTDLHCDTLYALYKKRLSYNNPSLHLSTQNESVFEHHTQVFAIWSEHKLTPDAAWEQFHAILSHAKKADIPKKVRSILSVEGGALLGNDLSRLDVLYDCGVRILTLVWEDICAIGGAHDTAEGLTSFGKQVVARCMELGIHPDLSHASDKMFWEVAETMQEKKLSLLATHSNSRSICHHSRNLTDEMFKAIRDSHGVAGISMAALHLKEGGNATITDILRHIEHYFSLGGEDTVALGCDFDGISSSPREIQSMYDLPLLAEHLARLGYSDCQIEKIFYRNADRFLKEILV